MNLNNILNLIKQHEGFVAKVYKCPAGKLTIGYGFNIEDFALPKKVADYWLEEILKNHFIPALKKIFKDFDSFSDNQKAALIDMIYNLGETKFLTFKKTINYINNSSWQNASKQVLNSKWARQVKGRAVKISKLLNS